MIYVSLLIVYTTFNDIRFSSDCLYDINPDYRRTDTHFNISVYKYAFEHFSQIILCRASFWFCVKLCRHFDSNLSLLKSWKIVGFEESGDQSKSFIDRGRLTLGWYVCKPVILSDCHLYHPSAFCGQNWWRAAASLIAEQWNKDPPIAFFIWYILSVFCLIAMP